MQFDPRRNISSFPFVRVFLALVGCALMAYCFQYYLTLPQTRLNTSCATWLL